MFWYDENKIKPQLKMAVHRFQIASNKKAALLKQNKREIASLLSMTPLPKEEKARIRAEAVIRDDYTVEAYELLQLNCELLAERIKFISNTKTCPPEMKGCISTLIWAAERVDIPELLVIRKQLQLKYGSKFIRKAEDNEGGVVNERVVARLSIIPPSSSVVRSYLVKIAEEYDVKWDPPALQSGNTNDIAAAPDGYSVPVAFGADRPQGEAPTMPDPVTIQPGKEIATAPPSPPPCNLEDDVEDIYFPGTNYLEKHKKLSEEDDLPLATATVLPDTPSDIPTAVPFKTAIVNSDEEKDIDLSSPPVVSSSIDTPTKTECNNADEGANDIDYNELLARFDALKK